MVIFFHGDDTYRSRAALRELRERFVREVDPSGVNLVVIDGTTAEAGVIWGAIAAQSFLVHKRMVVIEDIGAAKGDAVRVEVAALLPKVPEDVMVIFWEGRSCSPGAKRNAQQAKPKKSSKNRRGVASPPPAEKKDPIFPLLLKEKYAQEFTPLIGAELERWVTVCASTRDATFAPGACRELCAIVGGDLWRMTQEVEKLAMAGRVVSLRGGEADEAIPVKSSTPGLPRPRGRGFATTGDTTTITPDLIRALVATAPTDNVFAFVDALGRGDQASAIRELQRLEIKEQKPEYLLAMIARQLRLLLMAADCIARGESSTATVAALGGSPFVAHKVMEQARRHSVASLRALYPKLLDLDLSLKSSRSPKPALLEAFVLEATTPVT